MWRFEPLAWTPFNAACLIIALFDRCIRSLGGTGLAPVRLACLPRLEPRWRTPRFSSSARTSRSPAVARSRSSKRLQHSPHAHHPYHHRRPRSNPRSRSATSTPSAMFGTDDSTCAHCTRIQHANKHTRMPVYPHTTDLRGGITQIRSESGVSHSCCLNALVQNFVVQT